MSFSPTGNVSVDLYDPTEDDDQDGKNNDSDDELSGGAIAGIVIGVLFFVAIFSGVVFYVMNIGVVRSDLRKNLLDIEQQEVPL